MNWSLSTAVALVCVAMPAGCADRGSWGSAQQLSRGWWPQLAADPAGDVVAVWNSGSYSGHVMASRLEPGAGWGPVEQIDDSPGDQLSAQVGVDTAGDAIALWTGGTPRGMSSNRFVPGSGWQGATAVELPADQGHVESFILEVAPDGSAVAIFMMLQPSQTNPVESAWVVDFTPASGWGSATRVTSPTGDGIGWFDVAIGRNGHAFAVGQGNDGTLWASQRDPGSDWSAASAIGEFDLVTSGLRIAVDSDGNATAVWGTYLGGVWANHFVTGAGWGTATQIGAGAVVQGVEADDTGRVIAVWTGQDSLNYTDVFTPTEGWSAPHLVSAPDTTNGAILAVAPDGRAAVVWIEFRRRRDSLDGSWGRLMSSQFDPGAGWSAPVALETDTVEGYALTTDRNGIFTAAWVDTIDGYIRVRASH